MDEIPKYRKKAKKNTPKKSKHKHTYEPCVFEYRVDVPWGHDNTRKIICSYCSICGKIGAMLDREKWIDSSRGICGYFADWSDAAMAEFNEETRTLPYFFLNDYLKQKYVDIEVSDD